MRQIKKILDKMLLNELMEALESEIETNEYPNYPLIPAAFLERKFRDEYAWREEDDREKTY